jgi:EAL domain-containing protein (putative c-di-GMP-specific phosphodiesterase class I)
MAFARRGTERHIAPQRVACPTGHSRFCRERGDTIDEFGIAGASVCLEITERAVVRDIETTRRTLEALKEVGVQIAIDDFGTGRARHKSI